MIKLDQVIKKFKSNNRKEVTVGVIKRSDLNGLLNMINSIIAEDDFIWLNKKVTKKEEDKWLREEIKKIRAGESIHICSVINKKIVGNSSVEKRSGRLSHVGNFGITIMDGFREDGIGSVLIKEIVKLAKKELKIKLLTLAVFGTNKRALDFYKKMNFKFYGELPKGC